MDIKLPSLKEETEQEESLSLGILLANSIGILNACTYNNRGKVFASSQTGNLLYLGMDLARLDFSNIPKYLFPAFFFMSGVILGERIRDKHVSRHWRSLPTLLEVLFITGATFLPLSLNWIANPLFGFVCGLQAVTFSKIHKISVATVFLDGNVRNAVQNFARYLNMKDEEDLFKAVLYFIIVASYLTGIIAGTFLSNFVAQYVSLLSVVLVFISWRKLVKTEKFLDSLKNEDKENN